MLVSNKELMDAAKAGGYAVGAFNINNMEFVQAITDAAEELNSPAILAVSQGAIKYAGFSNIVSLVRTASENKKVKLSLHLDHGKDMQIIEQCINDGFTSVMIDGSDLPLDENIAVTRKVVEMARPNGISVEGELGRLAGIEDHVSVSKENATYTDPDEAAEFVEKTGVDSLAVAIGTSHGAYKFKGDAKLAMDRLTEIIGKVGVPLVLHGASGVNQEHVKMGNEFGAKLMNARGVPDEAITEAVNRGICKVNIDTDMRIAFTVFIRKTMSEKPDVFDPRKYLGAGRDAIVDVVKYKIDLFGSKGKAF